MLCPVCSDTEAAPEESGALELLMVAPPRFEGAIRYATESTSAEKIRWLENESQQAKKMRR
jgi:hypothetical protein